MSFILVVLSSGWLLPTSSLDTIGRAAFAYDFGCLSGECHMLLDALDGLTNNEHKRLSFYMRALFWLVPSILYIGEKGKMIRQVKYQLGEISYKMWIDAKLARDPDNQTLMANMSKSLLLKSLQSL